jgi:hypothetical protein
MILQALVGLLLALVGAFLGGYILFLGRRKLWATMGIIGLSVAGNVLAVLVAGVDSGWDLFDVQAWGLVVIALVIGALGVLLGRYLPDLAVSVIGFAAGADVALWLYEIVAYAVSEVPQLSEGTAVGIGLVLILIGGLLGLWLVRSVRDEALILITVVIGAEIIQDALGLSRSSSLTAIIIVGLVLAGVLVQYADYLRQLKASRELTEPEPAPSSIAYFQDLELDR